MYTCWTRKAAEAATEPKIAINIVMSKITSAINLLGHERKLIVSSKANKANALHQHDRKDASGTFHTLYDTHLFAHTR